MVILILAFCCFLLNHKTHTFRGIINCLMATKLALNHFVWTIRMLLIRLQTCKVFCTRYGYAVSSDFNQGRSLMSWLYAFVFSPPAQVIFISRIVLYCDVTGLVVNVYCKHILWVTLHFSVSYCQMARLRGVTLAYALKRLKVHHCDNNTKD